MQTAAAQDVQLELDSSLVDHLADVGYDPRVRRALAQTQGALRGRITLGECAAKPKFRQPSSEFVLA